MHCCYSVAKSCLTLCDPMNWSMPGFSALHYLPEFVQTQVQWVNDTIQPSHACGPLLLLPSIFPSFRIQWVSSSDQMARVLEFASVHFSSVAQSSANLCDPMDCSTRGFPVTNSWSLLKLMSIESITPSNRLILCHPLLLLPSIFPSNRVFSNESPLRIRWPEYWSFGFSIRPSNEYSGLIALGWTGWISLQCKGLSRVFSNTAVQKHQFFGAPLSS